MKLLLIIITVCFACCNDSNQQTGIDSRDTVNRKKFAPNSVTLKNKDTIPPSLSPRAIDNPHWKKKREEGVDFFVVGNEPFWSLELKNGMQVNFRLAEWERDSMVRIDQSFQPGKKNDINANGIQILISPGQCSDGMSDYIYDYGVIVVYKGLHYQGCGIDLR